MDLSDFPIVENTCEKITVMGGRFNVLILHDACTMYVATIRHHVHSFCQYSRNNIFLVDFPTARGTSIDVDKFDVIVFHYSVIVARAFQENSALVRKIRNHRGYKVLFIQDEQRWVDMTVAAMVDFGVHVVYSVMNRRMIERVYHHPCISHVRKKSVLTGYVAVELVRAKVPNFSERPIDVGYRARKLPSWMGHHAQEKWLIGERFMHDAEKHKLVCNIEHKEGERLYGKRWIGFVANCKAMLGTESGSGYVDFEGKYETYHSNNRPVIHSVNAGRFRESQLGAFKINMISPRCFEAAALRTLMILYPGSYSGILEPWRHYVPLERSHGNMNDVVAMLREPQQARRIIDNAYQEIALNQIYSYQAMVEEFDSDLEKYAPRYILKHSFLADGNFRNDIYQKKLKYIEQKIKLEYYLFTYTKYIYWSFLRNLKIQIQKFRHIIKRIIAIRI